MRDLPHNTRPKRSPLYHHHLLLDTTTTTIRPFHLHRMRAWQLPVQRREHRVHPLWPRQVNPFLPWRDLVHGLRSWEGRASDRCVEKGERGGVCVWGGVAERETGSWVWPP